MPQRPLNGRREVALVISSYDGSTFGSHVNFTCDPFFELTGGASRIYCNNGKWTTDNVVPPKCTRSKDICTDMPPNRTDSTVLLSVTGFDIEEESLGEFYKKKVKIYTMASYVCAFSNLVFADTSRKVSTRARKNPLLPPYRYQNSTCLGNNVWQSLPQCVRLR